MLYVCKRIDGWRVVNSRDQLTVSGPFRHRKEAECRMARLNREQQELIARERELAELDLEFPKAG